MLDTQFDRVHTENMKFKATSRLQAWVNGDWKNIEQVCECDLKLSAPTLKHLGGDVDKAADKRSMRLSPTEAISSKKFRLHDIVVLDEKDEKKQVDQVLKGIYLVIQNDHQVLKDTLQNVVSLGARMDHDIVALTTNRAAAMKTKCQLLRASGLKPLDEKEVDKFPSLKSVPLEALRVRGVRAWCSRISLFLFTYSEYSLVRSEVQTLILVTFSYLSLAIILLECYENSDTNARTQVRFQILQIFNFRLRNALPLIDVSSKEGIGHKLRKVRERIFIETKKALLASAVVSTRRKDLHKQLGLKLDRSLANKQNKPREVSLSSGLFSQALGTLASPKAPQFLRGLPGEQVMSIEYKGEIGVDAGGLFNDTLTALCDELFSGELNLFLETPNTVAKSEETLIRSFRTRP